MERILLLLALYLPFQLALNPAAGIDLASIRVFILLAFFIWLAKSLKNKRLCVENKAQTWLIAAFLFLNLISVAVARNSDWSLRKLLFLFSIFPLYFVVSDLTGGTQKILKISKALVYSGVAVALIGIGQFALQFLIGLDATYKLWAKYAVWPFLGQSFGEAVLSNPSWLVNIAGQTYLRATAIFPDPHMLAFYLGMLIPLALGIFFQEKNRKIMWFCFLILLVIADLLTFSRGGYLGLMAGAVALAILFWSKMSPKHKLGLLMMTLAILAALLVPSPISQRFYSSFNLKEGSNAGRIATWNQAWQVIMDKPWLGVGIGNYPLAVKPTSTYREPIYAHSAYLDVMADTGAINGLIWTGLLLAAFLSFYHNRSRNILFLMLSVSILIFSVHSLVETPIYSPVVLSLLVLFLGFSAISRQNEQMD